MKGNHEMNVSAIQTQSPVAMQGADVIRYHKAAPAKRDLSHMTDDKLEACAEVARRNVDAMERDNSIDGTPLPKWYSGLRGWCMQCEDEIERRNALTVDAYIAEVVSKITAPPQRKPRANAGRRTPRNVAVRVQ
jgi:hypothetical protein